MIFVMENSERLCHSGVMQCDLESAESQLRNTSASSHQLDLRRPHFKKDSRFVSDLYTLAYDPDTGGGDEWRQNGQLNYLNLQGNNTFPHSPGEIGLNSAENDGYVEDDDLWRLGASCLVGRTRNSCRDDEEIHTINSDQSYQSLPAYIGETTSSQMMDRQDVSPASAQLRLARRQLQLQEEARLALAQAGRMARWQSELDRQNGGQLSRQIMAHVIFGAPETESESRPTEHSILRKLSTNQLLLLISAFNSKINELNISLLQLLEERDQQLQLQDERLTAAEQAISCTPAASTADYSCLPPVQLLETARSVVRAPSDRPRRSTTELANETRKLSQPNRLIN